MTSPSSPQNRTQPRGALSKYARLQTYRSAGVPELTDQFLGWCHYSRELRERNKLDVRWQYGLFMSVATRTNGIVVSGPAGNESAWTFWWLPQDRRWDSRKCSGYTEVKLGREHLGSYQPLWRTTKRNRCSRKSPNWKKGKFQGAEGWRIEGQKVRVTRKGCEIMKGEFATPVSWRKEKCGI